MTTLPFGTIIVLLFWRVVNRGRDFLCSSVSASDDELLDEGGLAPPSALELVGGLGIEGVTRSAGCGSGAAMFCGMRLAQLLCAAERRRSRGCCQFREGLLLLSERGILV
jgi:hypothetical protein